MGLLPAGAAAANQTLKVKVTGSGSVSANEGAISGCEEKAGTCEGEYTEAATIILSQSHNERTAFGGWSGACSGTGTCEVTMSAVKEVEAKFEPITQEQLKVKTTEGTGQGTVTGGPGGEFTSIDCGNGGSTCTAEYNKEATITLTATRATHSRFTGWEGCTHEISTNEYTASECEVQMSAARMVRATFAAIPQANLELTAEGPGEVSSSPSGIACTSGPPCHAEFDTEGPESTVTLTAVHNERTAFAGWTEIEGHPGTCTGTASPCEVTMSAAVKLKSKFTPITQEALTVSPEGTGIGTVTGTSLGGEFTTIECGNGPTACEATYNLNTPITLTAIPPEHSRLVGWGAGQCETVHGTECTVTMSAAKHVTATFISLYTLTVSRAGFGSISASSPPISECSPTGGTCSGEYDEASTVTLTATPTAHKHVAWEGCTPQPEDPIECKASIGAANSEVKVAFPFNRQTLTITPTGPGSLTANSGPIRGCSAQGGTCSGSYIEAATLTLAAIPGPGQAVAWQGCTPKPDPDECELEIGASETAVKAAFAPIAHALKIAKGGTGQGQVTCNGSPCAVSYPQGTALTLTATPAAGSTFVGWSGGGCSGTGTCHLTLEADTTITATFTAKPPPAEEHCLVPALAGKTLAQARSALASAHCTLGTVTKPKKKKGALVVRSSSPSAATTLPANSQVSLTLGPKHKKKH